MGFHGALLLRGLPDGTAQPNSTLAATITDSLTAGLANGAEVGYTDINSELKKYPKEGEPYQYTGTREHVAEIAAALPEQDDELLRRGWEDISHPNKRGHGFHVYRESSTGLKIQFDVAKPNPKGETGRNHYHIFNPDVHNYDDKYLDIFGNPVAKGTEESHIFPKGG
ncbi:MAG: hypothetical protein IJT07_00270 [Oscillospiraceae bacterium]|nr:hypothetical protein [Oscillospiraceae bacterium]